MSEWPQVDQSKCNSCGVCITVCSNSALVMTENGIELLHIGECDWCGQCEAVCPTGAICCPYEIVLEE